MKISFGIPIFDLFLGILFSWPSEIEPADKQNQQTNVVVNIGQGSITNPTPPATVETKVNLHNSLQSDSLCNIGNSLLAHKCKLCMLGIFTSYSYLLYQFKRTENLLAQCDAWSNWKSVVPVAHLSLASSDDLLEQLQFDILKKYTLKSKTLLTSDLLAMFVDDLKYELACLQHYLTWRKFITKCHCASLFSLQFDQQTIEEKIARIHFIFDLFIKIQSDSSRDNFQTLRMKNK